MVYGLWFRAYGLGYTVSGLWLRVKGSEFGFRV
jgi:hypothetical protein